MTGSDDNKKKFARRAMRGSGSSTHSDKPTSAPTTNSVNAVGRATAKVTSWFFGETEDALGTEGPSLEVLEGLDAYAPRSTPITTLDVRYIEDETDQRRAVLKAVGDELASHVQTFWNKLMQRDGGRNIQFGRPRHFPSPQVVGTLGFPSVDQGVYDLQQATLLNDLQKRRKHHPQASRITIDIADWHLGMQDKGSGLSSAPSSVMYQRLADEKLLAGITGVVVYSGKTNLDFTVPHNIDDQTYREMVVAMRGNTQGKTGVPYVMALRKSASTDADAELLAKAIIGAQYLIQVSHDVVYELAFREQPREMTAQMRRVLHATAPDNPIARIGSYRFIVSQISKAGSSVETFVEGNDGILGFDKLARMEYTVLKNGIGRFYQQELAQKD